jgi:hypothetical protein
MNPLYIILGIVIVILLSIAGYAGHSYYQQRYEEEQTLFFANMGSRELMNKKWNDNMYASRERGKRSNEVKKALERGAYITSQNIKYGN